MLVYTISRMYGVVIMMYFQHTVVVAVFAAGPQSNC